MAQCLLRHLADVFRTHQERPLSGAKRTCLTHARMSAHDPKRTRTIFAAARAQVSHRTEVCAKDLTLARAGSELRVGLTQIGDRHGHLAGILGHDRGPGLKAVSPRAG